MATLDFAGWEMGMNLPAVGGSSWVIFGTPKVWLSNVAGVARTGEWALEMSTPDNSRAGIQRVLSASEENATLIAGVAVARYRDTYGPFAGTIFEFCSDSGATQHVSIGYTTAGRIEARLGDFVSGTLLATSTASQALDTSTTPSWYFIEAKVTLSATTGSVVVRVNGEPWINLSSINTKNGGTKTVFDTFGLGKCHAGAHVQDYGRNRYDDLYLLSGDAVAPNDFMGAVAIYGVKPSGVGSASSFTNSAGNTTDNFSYVDDIGGTDYVQSATAGAQDLYATQDLPTSFNGNVKAVKVLANVQNTDAALRQLKLGIKHGTTVAMDAGQGIGAGTAQGIQRIMKTNPVTGADWTPADVNAMEVGAEVV